jgi:hypothetical protein
LGAVRRVGPDYPHLPAHTVRPSGPTSGQAIPASNPARWSSAASTRYSATVLTNPGRPLVRDPDGVRFYDLHGAPSNPPSFDFSVLPAGSTVIDVRYVTVAEWPVPDLAVRGRDLQRVRRYLRSRGPVPRNLPLARWRHAVLPQALRAGSSTVDQFVVAVPLRQWPGPRRSSTLAKATISADRGTHRRVPARADRQLVTGHRKRFLCRGERRGPGQLPQPPRAAGAQFASLRLLPGWCAPLRTRDAHGRTMGGSGCTSALPPSATAGPRPRSSM